MNKPLRINLDEAAYHLRNGRVVAIPTETVYGLAANALDEQAVSKIFAIKSRPATNPLIVHLSSAGEAGKYAVHIPQAASLLMEAFWPGPLTLVLPKKAVVPGIVTAGRDTVALRVPAHPLALDLLKVAGIPLAAPSANPSGFISPTNAGHVAKALGDKLDYILDGGPCLKGIESTIVGFEGEVPVIYRQGVITATDISAVTGEVKEYTGDSVLAPGMIKAHYSPVTPFMLADDIDVEVERLKHLNLGIITYGQFVRGIVNDRQVLLSSGTDLQSAAQNLYAAMHQSDERGYDMIIARKFPATGIGLALNDRLIRAAAKN